jgi:hypothetical protein
MPDNRSFQPPSALYLFGAAIAGAACTLWIPSDWFLSLVACSIGVSLVLAVFAIWGLKNERRPSIPVTIILELLWLPSRNGEVKYGPVLWSLMAAISFVIGLLVTALLLPVFT